MKKTALEIKKKLQEVGGKLITERDSMTSPHNLWGEGIKGNKHLMLILEEEYFA
ncbi:hypothetical protein WKH54_25760 [Priestia megaterium]|uniref:hypothetical protein n=1 Tax=Priestia megaterium TaxID=1404 RepID=UPI00317EEA35